MAGQAPHDPDRALAIIVPLLIFPILSTIFVVWRLSLNVLVKKTWRLSDVFIAFAAVRLTYLCLLSLTSHNPKCCTTDSGKRLQASNITSEAFSIAAAVYAEGRHIYDPSLTPADIKRALEYVFVAQVTNLFSMFLLKVAIADYLLALRFTPQYVLIIRTSLVPISAFNLIMPAVMIFGSCKPIALNWDKSLQGSCWPPMYNAASGYAQSGKHGLEDKNLRTVLGTWNIDMWRSQRRIFSPIPSTQPLPLSTSPLYSSQRESILNGVSGLSLPLD